jgi:hypothetical protein
MPIHDWTRVEASTFHDFHSGWIVHLKEALNRGKLPQGYYAQAEQHVGRKIADVLTLHISDPDRLKNLPAPTDGGAVAVAEAPPRVRRTMVLAPPLKKARRTLTIRHTTGHRIVALVEVLSPGNKASASDVGEFVRKVEEALRAGIHVVLVDPLPPGRHDPSGVHGAIVEAISTEEDDLPHGKPLTLASYAARTPPVAYVEHLAVGDGLPAMPLFLTPDHYVNLPLEATYQAAFEGMPGYWREVLEART